MRKMIVFLKMQKGNSRIDLTDFKVIEQINQGTYRIQKHQNFLQPKY